MSVLSKLQVGLAGGWLPDQIRGSLRREPVPDGATVHVLLMIADHWEPLWKGASRAEADERARRWATRYPRIASRHVDADGRHPQHTFFYPWDEYRRSDLEAIAELSAVGFGEVELHLHHRDDTSASLRHKLEDAVGLFRRAGCFGSRRDGRPAFGFVHGDWALDNSGTCHGRNFCGVNDEIRLLADAGCYADYTFPAFGSPAQPRWVNRIMRVTDDPGPKSYNRGVEARVGAVPPSDLVLLHGPLLFHRGERRLRLDDASLTHSNPCRPDRIAAWLRARVHVRGRPEWLFVKLHTHGCTTANCAGLLDGGLERLWTQLEARCGDGERYRLHYVTAREAYNILRAAEDGHAGDPNHFRDYEIAPPPCRTPPPPPAPTALRERELEMSR
jgi:hypothetical protein